LTALNENLFTFGSVGAERGPLCEIKPALADSRCSKEVYANGKVPVTFTELLQCCPVVVVVVVVAVVIAVLLVGVSIAPVRSQHGLSNRSVLPTLQAVGGHLRRVARSILLPLSLLLRLSENKYGNVNRP
jgi:hypothetical protein